MVKIEDVNVGDHITVCLYTDRVSYTVIRKTKAMIEAQKDHQNIDKEKWKAEWYAGGFAGHCANQDLQKWIVKPDPEGKIIKIFSQIYLRARAIDST